MKKAAYLDYIEKTVAHGRTIYDQSVEQWRNSYNPKQFFGMYTAPGVNPVQVHIEGFMYHVTGDLAYAKQARQYLLDIGAYRDIVTEEQLRQHPEYAVEIPAMEAAFQSPHYVYGYKYIKDSGVLSAAECSEINRWIASSIRTTMHFPEWGAHNRCMLRVWATVLGSSVVEPTEEWAYWNKLSDEMARDSISGWSIEDAQAYTDLWLIGTMEYAKYRGREEEYYSLPHTRYYFDYIARLITPYGQVPDYGDSNFNATWYLWLPILEKGAAVYKDARMKYAADKLFEFGIATDSAPHSHTVAAFLALAYQWADDELTPVRPEWGSGQLMDDLVGKKIVFRSGWEDNDSYLLLNYRDEGEYGYIARNNLRTSIPVKAEKAHHGHSDENAVIMLASGRNILLHDGGYREQVPNGKYRADIYHNRLVFRNGDKLGAADGDVLSAQTGLPGETSAVYNLLHDEGFYKPVTTMGIHFQAFERLDYSRTRVCDPHRQVIWDRMMTYLRDENVYIAVDWVQSEADQTLTIANLWHTAQAEQSAPGCLQTRIPYIHRSPGCKNPYTNRDELGLLIEFPGTDRLTGWERIRRNYGDGIMIYEAEATPLRKGEMRCFVTVLTPYALSDSHDQHTGKVTVAELSPESDLLTLTYSGKTEIKLAYKLDLLKGLLEEATFSGSGTRFTWEDGKMAYGSLVTDADFAFVETKDRATAYGLLNGSGLYEADKPLFVAPQRSAYEFSTMEWHTVIHKWRSWEGEVKN